jgi:hypothetical protein
MKTSTTPKPDELALPKESASVVDSSGRHSEDDP